MLTCFSGSSGADSDQEPRTPAGEPDLAAAGVTQSQIGLNVEPGSGDDGWETPPPVHLEDGTRLQLYKDGQALGAAIEAVKHAKRRILLEVYIWPSDDTGKEFAEVLAEKARSGVAVYAIYDSFGSLLAGRQMFDEMRRAGIRLIEFHPMLPWKSRYSWRPANRDHRKLLVIDDHIAGVGGLNLGNRYGGSWVAKLARLDHQKLWRDAAMGIIGPSARNFARSFARTWHYCLHRGPIEQTLWYDGLCIEPATKGGRLGKVRQTPRQTHRRNSMFADGCDLAPLATSPTLSSPLRPFLYRLMRDARRSISMTMAYFAPDDELISCLCDAAIRGARVRLMLAGRSDMRLVIWAGRAFYERLLDAGVEIYERQGAMLHQKSIVVDGRIGVLGSTNLDYRSIEFNLELSAVIRSEAFGGQLETLFNHDVRHAEKIDPARWRRRPLLDRLVQGTVSRMRYLL